MLNFSVIALFHVLRPVPFLLRSFWIRCGSFGIFVDYVMPSFRFMVFLSPPFDFRDCCSCRHTLLPFNDVCTSSRKERGQSILESDRPYSSDLRDRNQNSREAANAKSRFGYRVFLFFSTTVQSAQACMHIRGSPEVWGFQLMLVTER